MTHTRTKPLNNVRQQQLSLYANIRIYGLIVTNFKARKLSSIRITDKPRTENVYSAVFVYRLTNNTHEEYAEIKLQTNHSYKNPLISRSVNYYCQ